MPASGGKTIGMTLRATSADSATGAASATGALTATRSCCLDDWSLMLSTTSSNALADDWLLMVS